MQGPNEYNFIYNDGDFQIRGEEIISKVRELDKEENSVKKYYLVDKAYEHIASFKEKREALLYVGWRNTRILKESLLKDSLKETHKDYNLEDKIKVNPLDLEARAYRGD